MPTLGQTRPVLDRIAAKSTQVGECWVFNGYRNKLGYGVVNESHHGNVTRHLTHRAAYMATVADELDGLVLDHLCRNTSCWNPDHLEPVKQRVNVARGALGFELEGTCRSGHPINGSEDYYILKNGDRRCRKCRLASNRAGVERRAAAMTKGD